MLCVWTEDDDYYRQKHMPKLKNNILTDRVHLREAEAEREWEMKMELGSAFFSLLRLKWMLHMWTLM